MKKSLFIILFIEFGFSQNDNTLVNKNFDTDKYLEALDRTKFFVDLKTHKRYL